MFFAADFLRPAKRSVVERITAPKSIEGTSKQVVAAVTPREFSLQPTRDDSSGSGWCTDPTAQRPVTLPRSGRCRRGSGVSLGTKFYAKLAALGFAVGLLCTGCGTGMTVVALMSPSISQVSPQVVTAGTANVTVTVQGTNFESQAALMVNGSAVPTTVMNSTTIAANIPGTTLAQPAVQQLQVKNSNGGSSNQVPFTVTAAPDGGNDLAITTTQLPSVQVGTAYKVNLAATGGTAPYKWSV